METANDNLASDVLKGAEEIAEFIGEDRRSVYHAIKKGTIPTYRIGASIRARRSTLRDWIAKQEGAAA